MGAVLFASTEGKRRIQQGVCTGRFGAWAEFSVDTCCENPFANGQWGARMSALNNLAVF